MIRIIPINDSDEVSTEEIDNIDYKSLYTKLQTDYNELNDKLSLFDNFVKNKFEEFEKIIKEKDDLISLKSHEFENYKKRTDSEKQTLTRYEGTKIIYELLQVIDDLELAIKYDNNNTGIKLIYNKFISILENYNIKQMNTVGQLSDFNLHDVVHIETRDDMPNGIILDEIQKGYMYHDKCLRFPKVIINSKTECNE